MQQAQAQRRAWNQATVLCPSLARAALVAGLGFASPLLWSVQAQAQGVRASGGGTKSLELRASFSAEASSFFSEPRLRRLLAIELQNTAVVSSSPAGPLSDQVAWTWIDLPQRSTVVMEARLAVGGVSRRTIGIEGLGPDAAARHVAIAVAEMVRSLAHPSRARKPVAGKPPCCELFEVLSHAMPTLAWRGGGGAAVVTGEPSILAGPSIGLGLRYHQTGARVFGRWLGGDSGFGPLSWLEGGMGIDQRFSLHPSWRVFVGLLASAATVRLGGVKSVDGVQAGRVSWSARAGASVGVETRLGDATWLSLSTEPGAILRNVGFEERAGARGELSGAWIGLDLSLQYERRP